MKYVIDVKYFLFVETGRYIHKNRKGVLKPLSIGNMRYSGDFNC